MGEKGQKPPTLLAEEKTTQQPMGGDIISIHRPAKILPFKEKKTVESPQTAPAPEPVDEQDALESVLEMTKKIGDMQNSALVTIADLISSDERAYQALVSLRDPRIEGDLQKSKQLENIVRSALTHALSKEQDESGIKSASDILPWEKLSGDTAHYHNETWSIKSEQGKEKAIDSVKRMYWDIRKMLEKIDDPHERAKAWDSLTDDQQLGVMVLQENVQIHYDYRLLQRLCDAGFRASFDKRKQGAVKIGTEPVKERTKKKEEYDRSKQEFLNNAYTLEFPGEGCLRLERITEKHHGQTLWKVVEVFGGSKALRHELSIALHSGNTYLKDLSNAPTWLRDAAKAKGLI